jgi:cytochrome c peroxidase
LYESKAGCWRCHAGANFTDEAFHATGVGARDGVAQTGRLAVTGDALDLGRFKTPSLRGLGATAPYMHDGSLASLAEVVEFYRKGGGAIPSRDPALRPLELTEAEARSLVAFLEALSRPAQ